MVNAFLIETIISLIDFNLLNIFANLTTLNILKTLKKDNCELNDFLEPTISSLTLLFGVAISNIAKQIIIVSKYVKASE